MSCSNIITKDIIYYSLKYSKYIAKTGIHDNSFIKSIINNESYFVFIFFIYSNIIITLSKIELSKYQRLTQVID